jgi:hypothetical protein
MLHQEGSSLTLKERNRQAREALYSHLPTSIDGIDNLIQSRPDLFLLFFLANEHFTLRFVSPSLVEFVKLQGSNLGQPKRKVEGNDMMQYLVTTTHDFLPGVAGQFLEMQKKFDLCGWRQCTERWQMNRQSGK